jgi:hypothetical protein
MAVKKNSETISTLPFKVISVLFSVAVAIFKFLLFLLLSFGRLD